MADGTQLNQNGTSGDTIATEDMPAGAVRGDDLLPKTPYKVPRSKLVVGDYDHDEGDVSRSRPLAVENMDERHAAEAAALQGYAVSMQELNRRASIRDHQLDRRGDVGLRGMRR